MNRSLFPQIATELCCCIAGELLGQICGVGYCLVLCIGINFLGMTKIKTANMLPALLVPVLWSFLQPLFSGAA